MLNKIDCILYIESEDTNMKVFILKKDAH